MSYLTFAEPIFFLIHFIKCGMIIHSLNHPLSGGSYLSETVPDVGDREVKGAVISIKDVQWGIQTSQTNSGKSDQLHTLPSE